ncbi:iron-containing alcohol dehydrogenase [Clostridium baratii]|uniref:1-propanol dehydrogenase PduQ n=1 Tax=Clostridium baratii TaxID=1561 RepID=UPI0006C313D4|nr:1-propanol dehydrogenase PduQ [Clostridium baratii]CUP55349.1 iron-containing alcohol dehydrogenase [Clostridium baratii]
MKEFSLKTKIYFGEGSLNKLSEISNKNVLIICDKFIEKSKTAEKISNKLNNCKISIFSDIIPDPSVQIVALGVQKLRDLNADIIIALGGGSSIDGAKAIREYYTNLFKEDSKTIEFYAIPTTSGTGSEVTDYAVITNKEENLKYALTDKSLLPDVAILDAELTKTVPRSITADTGMDVITHAIEAYVSKNSNDFSDALAEKALCLAFNNLKLAYNEPENIVPREKLHNASCLAGMAFNASGLGITHSLAHAIGGKLHIPHGKANAIILPYVMEFNANINNNSYMQEYDLVALKYQRLAKILDINSHSTIIGVNNLIRNIIKLKRDLSIPKNLIDLGVDIKLVNDFREEIIDAALKDICTNSNPREVSRKDLEILLDKVIGI